MNLCIIPARGGSKRILRKNIKEFCGKPIIAYSIEAALESGLFSDVLVSTDDEEIALVASDWGASVPFLRPKELSDDFTGTMPVIKHAIDELSRIDREYEHVCCIYATAPFVTSETIKKSYDLLTDGGKEYVFTTCEFEAPIWRAFGIDESGSMEMFWPENYAKRSQDLPKAYHDAGQLYWGKSSAFLHELPIFSSYSKALILPRHLVQDIDTMDDWIRAEAMFRALEP